MDIKELIKSDFYDMEHIKSVTSTNDIVKELAKDGKDEGYVLIADSQTQGKGRLSRSFYSPDNSGIYMSILLRPKLQAKDFPLITTCCAVAVAKAIEKVFRIDTKIKWVNDIYISGKKVSGILVESGISNDSSFAVVGIGVNVSVPKDNFPDEIKDKAGAILNYRDDELKNKLTASILNEFYSIYSHIDDKSFYNDYKNRSFILGKRISFEKNAVTHNVTAIDIDENFGLVVKDENGKVFTLNTGEVSIVLDKKITD